MIKRIGILLAGGTGSRLLPLTAMVNKHFLPVFDKPMINYSLSLLMLGDISNIVVVCRDQDIHAFQAYLGDGSDLGLRLSFAIQPSPLGIPDAMLAATRAFGHPVTVVLGDNFLAGGNLRQVLSERNRNLDRCQIFTCRIRHPQKFGVVFRNSNGEIDRILEKPSNPPSNEAVVGLYNFPEDWGGRCQMLEPSARGELEIVDLINSYFLESGLDCTRFGRGYSWFDMGSPQTLFAASSFVETTQRVQGLPIGLLPEISLANGWISPLDLLEITKLPIFRTFRSYLTKLGDEYDARN